MVFEVCASDESLRLLLGAVRGAPTQEASIKQALSMFLLIQQSLRLDVIFGRTAFGKPVVLTLPCFRVHQIACKFLMNGGRYGQEGVGCESAVHR
jgi:hypothetical protein